MLECDYYQPSGTGGQLGGPRCVIPPVFTPLTVLTGRRSWACFSGMKFALVFWSDPARLRWLYNSTCQAKFTTHLGSLLSKCRLDRVTTLLPAVSLWKAWPLLRIAFQRPRHPAARLPAPPLHARGLLIQGDSRDSGVPQTQIFPSSLSLFYWISPGVCLVH